MWEGWEDGSPHTPHTPHTRYPYVRNSGDESLPPSTIMAFARSSGKLFPPQQNFI
ncbi:hypothetical protein H6G74_20845 [Nostoc spongiaeforme FACHB-130]|uniref:Uncharacterized protein n=1 Tax=Nostoc spongiaeforme FACHB-130 TaxID=1357510 RepID=A0ABR8G0K4_9NOSO|nr:hypothetical protein [Nostoc spongiaeforme FACHB-130]